MNKRLETLKQMVLAKEHMRYRKEIELDFSPAERAGSSSLEWETLKFCKLCKAEQPIILPDEKLVFSRFAKVNHMPTPAIYEDGRFGIIPANICADWEKAISGGLLGRREVAAASLKKYAGNSESVAFLKAAVATIDAVLDLAARYAAAARTAGRDDIVDVLGQVPAREPRTFREALQSLKFMHSCLWLNSCHVGLGRFDQYLHPYYRRDIDKGVLTSDEADELIAEFFISLNKDIDLYPGVQPGDNGQSLMLGGVTRSGEDAVNDLTWAVLRVSREVSMIDPKINLRVSSQTLIDLLREGAKLTRCGLGFPQYCNDEVVIPALVAHGYALEDARDYTVAACWEFIIPGKGLDVPNIAALSFPFAVDQAIRARLGRWRVSFEDLEKTVAGNIRDQVVDFVSYWRRFSNFQTRVYYSVLMSDCLERGKDIANGGCDYYNYGIHGAGSASAADALAIVKKLVYDEKAVPAGEILDALWRNWEGHEDLRQKILHAEERIGNHSPEADAMLKKLFDWFADACESIEDNGHGGIVRPGTGTAMYYIWLTQPGFTGREPPVGATADGRKVGDFLSSSLAPSPGIQVAGPIGVFQSFSKIDYSRVCNGGPVTMELSDTVFRDEEDLSKVAMLVSAFVRLGCQQLQMNVLNPEILEDAIRHPEQHRDLIVRVWGWSGYFVELAPEYQRQIIARHRYVV